jgi:hypothetical protein
MELEIPTTLPAKSRAFYSGADTGNGGRSCRERSMRRLRFQYLRGLSR